MIPISAIAKVRFSSAKGQRVHLVEPQPIGADLLCLESGQQISANIGIIYVLTGSAVVRQSDQVVALTAGQLLQLAANATIENDGQQRLVCLSFRTVQ